MKKLLLLAIVVLFVTVFSTNVSAQDVKGATTSNTASATILTPITLTKGASLEFGKLATKAGALGTATVTATASVVPDLSSTVTLVGESTQSAASFNVGGAENYAYNISGAPSKITIQSKDALGAVTGSMEIDAISVLSNNDSESSKGTLDGDGEDIIYVGGTLNIQENQPSGNYSGSFELTVNYN